MKLVFMLDFDGTITKKDVVATMVTKFCRDGWQDLNDRWEQGQLSTEDCANQTFALLDATLEEIYQLLDTIELDEYFPSFVQFCKDNNYPIYILSDGYQQLINYILQRHGLEDLTVYANKLVITADNHFSIGCQHSNPQCKKCGTCKKQLLHQLSANQTVVYVGDGYSDMCVCQQADILFAKDSLLAYCRQNYIPAICYTSFKQIIDYVKNISPDGC
ncbi:MtnX-like HAD-IB family phosphatase [Peptococcaceae bacterium 1198_IL3148]